MDTKPKKAKINQINLLEIFSESYYNDTLYRFRTPVVNSNQSISLKNLYRRKPKNKFPMTDTQSTCFAKAVELDHIHEN